jgi:hypothetical protein
MFSLTSREQILVVFIFLSLVAGAGIRYWRHLHHPPAAATPVVPAQAMEQN